MSPAATPRTLDELACAWNRPLIADERGLAARTALARELAAAILAASPGDENGRTRVGPLQIATAGWSKERGEHAYSVADPAVDHQAWIAALGAHEHATLTSDGQGANRDSWCVCANDDVFADQWVRYEHWTAAGCVAHGFVHSECRRLLQTG
jgi:hypothetical protein